MRVLGIRVMRVTVGLSWWMVIWRSSLVMRGLMGMVGVMRVIRMMLMWMRTRLMLLLLMLDKMMVLRT
jgi:hypothetical protein